LWEELEHWLQWVRSCIGWDKKGRGWPALDL